MNNDYAWTIWIGLPLAVVVGFQLVLFLSVWVQLLRVPIRRTHLRGAAVEGAEEPLLSADQQALLDELAALGFALQWRGRQDVEDGRGHAAVLLKHRDVPAWAAITFQASALLTYPISFYSFDAQGRMLLTQNRLGWLVLERRPEVLLEDPCAASLAEHWEAHQRRLDTAVAVDDEQAVARIVAQSDGSFDRVQQAGLLTAADGAWHFKLLPAGRAALAWWRARRKLAVPYRSAVTSDDHLPAFMASCYLEMEAQQASRPPRHNVKASVLVLSLVLSLALWSAAFTWQQAAALVAILFIHECGHALAMRVFGWKDMSMFFVPFVGAMVTGRPRDVAAWKQMVVLLAGPVPGLVAGVAGLVWLGRSGGAEMAAAAGWVDWRNVAVMAVAVNLFNLLPITPLDGGQLIDMALFSRWPRLRLVFAAASAAAMAALAYWLQSPTAWAIAAFLFISLTAQWRAAQLQAAWREGLPLEDQLKHLFDTARRLFRKQGAARLIGLVKAAVTRRMIRVPRLWESAATLAVLLGVWVPTGIVVSQMWPAYHSHAAADARSADQRAFDEAWERVEYGDDDQDDEADGTPGQAGPVHGGRLLELRAQALRADDPRLVDMNIRRVLLLPQPERRKQIEAILKAGRDGKSWTRKAMLNHELDSLARIARTLPARERLPMLREVVAWADSAAPQMFASTVDARLRMAEALDESGDTPAAQAMLAELRRKALGADDCRCELREVLRAQTWFHLSHQRADLALALLREPAVWPDAQTRKGGLAMDYAWALLLSGQTQAARTAMDGAARSSPYQPKLYEWLMGLRAHDGEVLSPVDLALVLERAGRAPEAVALLGRSRSYWQCLALREDADYFERDHPWQRERGRLLQDVARRLCPARPAPQS